MYTYYFENCKPAPGKFFKYLKELFENSSIWKKSEKNNQTFTHESDNGNIAYGFSNFNYFKLGNKEKNYLMFKNSYFLSRNSFINNE